MRRKKYKPESTRQTGKHASTNSNKYTSEEVQGKHKHQQVYEYTSYEVQDTSTNTNKYSSFEVQDNEARMPVRIKQVRTHNTAYITRIHTDIQQRKANQGFFQISILHSFVIHLL